MRAPAPRFQTKAEWVYAGLREMIATGELASGERLPMAQLAEWFQTSEMPVREALRMLQRDGLVQMESHRGATVAVVDWDRVVEIVSVRMHLEVLAAAEAAAHHTAQTLAPIDELVRRMDRLVVRRRGTEFSDANRRFHTMLYDPIPSPVLKEEIQSLWERMWRVRSQPLFRMDPDRARLAQREHRAMLDAVSRHDPVATEAAARAHRDATLEAWRSTVERLRGRSSSADRKTPAR
jgi:DNA-binding GntR family transcriptional regulator